METDPEVSGDGNSYTTMFRQYDPRLGRWKSLDPLAGKYPGESPFNGYGNNPIFYTDPLGLEPGNGGNDKIKSMQNGASAGKQSKNSGRKAGGMGSAATDYSGTGPIAFDASSSPVDVVSSKDDTVVEAARSGALVENGGVNSDEPVVFHLEPTQGRDGDWIASSCGCWEDYQPIYWVGEKSGRQIKAFAEAVGGTISYSKEKFSDEAYVTIDEDSDIYKQTLVELEKYGIFEEDLTENDKLSLRTFTFDTQGDNSKYFMVMPPTVMLATAVPISVAPPGAIPVVLPPSSGAVSSSQGAILIDASVLAEMQAQSIIYKMGARKATKGTKSEEAAEHTKNARPSTKGKHQKGRRRVKRDKHGGEKGDENRKRYK